MSGYNTNLAAEFHVLSVLHRFGAAATLTLGNKKGVDIVVAREAGDAVTIEVKGVAQRYDWPANNIDTANPGRHFVALVSFEGRIADATVAPRCWVIPFQELKPYLRQYKGRRNVSRSAVIRTGQRFENAWSRIVAEPAPKLTSKRARPARCRA
jgi:hypothetical protein